LPTLDEKNRGKTRLLTKNPDSKAMSVIGLAPRQQKVRIARFGIRNVVSCKIWRGQPMLLFEQLEKKCHAVDNRPARASTASWDVADAFLTQTEVDSSHLKSVETAQRFTCGISALSSMNGQNWLAPVPNSADQLSPLTHSSIEEDGQAAG